MWGIPGLDWLAIFCIGMVIFEDHLQDTLPNKQVAWVFGSRSNIRCLKSAKKYFTCSR